uniref:uncharacterized protein isoform X2 n=1 Tax=Myxine glutinosa TaxID=7769 RepID=UPI00358DE8A3
MAIYMSSDATTDGEEVDVRSSSKFEDSMKGVCFMHVLNKQSKVIPFKEKSARKFRECALEWIQLKGSYESKFAVKALTLDQHSLLHTWTATVGVGLAADAIAITDYEGEGSGRKQQYYAGYHARCYNHFCNITTIKRAITKRRKKKEAEKIQEEGSDALPNDEPLDQMPKRLLQSYTSDGQRTSAHQHTDQRYGDVMTLVFGSTLVVAVSDAATIREALGIGGDVLAGRPPLPLPLLLNNGARGLLCLHPIFWKD